MTPPLYGLVLTGGRSTRMGRDKAELVYHGRNQAAHAFALLAALTEQTFLSLRSDQTSDPLRAAYPYIVDQHQELGPVAGVVAAQRSHPHAAWLVVACDLPFLTAETLAALCKARAAECVATAFRAPGDGQPEPLCAIYEPRSAALVVAEAEAGKQSLRHFLQGSHAKLLALPDPRALDNVNSGEEYWHAMQTLAPDAPSTPRRLRVQYFAVLREQAGCSEEEISTPAQTPRELYEELRTRHPFAAGGGHLRVAVNGEFGDFEQPLLDGDVVVFLPPVAGG